MTKIHKKIIITACVAQVILSTPVLQGHQVFGITLDRFWNWSDKMFYILLLSVVTYPVSMLLDRSK